MKSSLLPPLLFVAGLSACDGPYFDLGVDEDLATGGSVSPPASGGSVAPPGSGGASASSSGGTRTGGAEGSGDPRPQLTRGGFGEAMDTFRNGERKNGFDESCQSPRKAFFVYEPGRCLAASACLEPCDPSSAAQTAITYREGELDEASALGECRGSTKAQGAPGGQSYFVFPCAAGETCPSGLVCVESELGPACFVRDVPWAEECAGRYCSSGESGALPEPRGEPCGDDHYCCPGFVCTATGECEPG